MRLEVRCCCTPRKLLGWIDVPDRSLAPYIRFCPLPAPSVADFVRAENVMRSGDVVTLSVAQYEYAPDRRTTRPYFALKAEGVPIETLRLLRGFEEAPP